MPTIIKSQNLYPPGFHTIKLVWYEKGVEKPAIAASTIVKTNNFWGYPVASAA